MGACCAGMAKRHAVAFIDELPEAQSTCLTTAWSVGGGYRCRDAQIESANEKAAEAMFITRRGGAGADAAAQGRRDQSTHRRLAYERSICPAVSKLCHGGTRFSTKSSAYR